ncbi:oligosaccharide flippase family protein [Vibrio parahaemolyticus]|nr:oligosaccharide flippase family protein [Vibrio parahaemolyticus]
MKNDIINIFKTTGFLTIIKLATVCTPLFVYPLVISSVGKTEFGEVLVFQSIVMFFLMFISFGFNLSATKALSEIEDKDKINTLFNDVFWSKVLITVFVIILYYITNVIWGSYTEKFFGYGFFYFFGEMLYCQWFFHGRGIVKKLTYIVFFTKIFTIISVLIISKINDVSGQYIALIFSLEYFFLGCASFLYAKYNYNLKIQKVVLKAVGDKIQEAQHLFSVIFITSLKDRFNLIIVAHFFSPAAVVVVDFAMKIVTILSLPSSILSQAAYPTNSKRKDKSLFFKILLIGGCITLTGYAFFFFVFDYINEHAFKFDAYNVSSIMIMAISSCFLSISSMIATNGLAAMGYNRELLINVVLTTAFYFASLLIFYIINDFNNLRYYLFVILFTYIFETISRVILAKKKRLL